MHDDGDRDGGPGDAGVAASDYRGGAAPRTHVPGPVSMPLVGLPPTVCGAHKAVTYEIFIFSLEFPYK